MSALAEIQKLARELAGTGPRRPGVDVTAMLELAMALHDQGRGGGAFWARGGRGRSGTRRRRPEGDRAQDDLELLRHVRRGRDQAGGVVA